MPELKTITTKGGARFTVAAGSAAKFEALLNDLEAGGYPIKGDQSGGYNDRNIAGTRTKSQHAFGNAVDVNWSDNPRGAAGKIPMELARNLAQKHGFTWGGDWKNPDPMHFELARGQPSPVSARGLTTVAGLAPPAPTPTSAPAAAAPTPAPTQASAPAPATATPEAPAADPYSLDSILKGLAPQERQQQPTQAPTAVAAMPELPQQMRRPVDLTRLREVLASRARLGTGAA